MHQPGQIVLEEALPLRREEGDNLLVVGRVGAGQAEIDLLALCVERHGLQAEGDSAVLVVREGLRPIDFKAQLADRRIGVAPEQFAHPLGIDRIGRHRLAEPRRIIKAQGDRLVDARQSLQGAA